MNILYLSCHETLEYYDVRNLRELGFNVFTIGHNTYPSDNQTFRKLAPNDPQLQKLFQRLRDKGKLDFNYKIGQHVRLHERFVNRFDIIVNAHWTENLSYNASLFKDKMNIYRSIASFSTGHEKFFKKYKEDGMKVIRLSPAEKYVPGYIGEDAVIRGSLDPSYYPTWTGEDIKVLTVNKMMDLCNSRMKPEYEKITEIFKEERILCGKENGTIPYSRNEVSEEELTQLRRRCRAYLALCSKKAPLVYTFSEALMAGMPVITFSKSLMGYDWFEQDDFIENGVSGFYGNTLEEIQNYIKLLFNDYDLAKSISLKARETALKYFSTDVAKEQWRQFFKTQYGIDTL